MFLWPVEATGTSSRTGPTSNGQPVMPVVAQAGLAARIGSEPEEPCGRTWTNFVPLSCHWKTKAAAATFSPSELNCTGPCTLWSVTPLCRYWMILVLSVPPVATIAWAATWPTEYASATSAFTPDALTWYCFTYSLTIALLAALLKPGYQPLGTIIPAALPAPTAEVNAAPWSGPD